METAVQPIKIFETPIATFYKIDNLDCPFFKGKLAEFPNKWSVNPLTNGNMSRQFYKIYNNDKPFILVTRKDKKQIYCAMLSPNNLFILFYEGELDFRKMNEILGITKLEFIQLFKL